MTFQWRAGFHVKRFFRYHTHTFSLTHSLPLSHKQGLPDLLDINSSPLHTDSDDSSVDQLFPAVDSSSLCYTAGSKWDTCTHTHTHTHTQRERERERDRERERERDILICLFHFLSSFSCQKQDKCRLGTWRCATRTRILTPSPLSSPSLWLLLPLHLQPLPLPPPEAN